MIGVEPRADRRDQQRQGTGAVEHAGDVFVADLVEAEPVRTDQTGRDADDGRAFGQSHREVVAERLGRNKRGPGTPGARASRRAAGTVRREAKVPDHTGPAPVSSHSCAERVTPP